MLYELYLQLPRKYYIQVQSRQFVQDITNASHSACAELQACKVCMGYFYMFGYVFVGFND